MSTEPLRSLRYVDDITRDDVLTLEAFIYSQLRPVQDAAGETGDTFCALRSLEILVCDSAGLLLALLDRSGRGQEERSTMLREWNRLWTTASWWNYRDGYDTDRWNRLDHVDAAAEASHHAEIARAQAGTGEAQ
ncbi:hypothetical protein JIX56_46970 [Streptomyces sp. CA-210063]|uniref:hypothetical protein n=1 Tax=Streptomyces sp. CA-210063 TaxID=2801029 RepID=UPI00214BBA91|nr:hypothetical protein [Streptomyces sp. CA-210063]UUU36748.1 hypothetical protein JIX56_46970 [Streptomyces sp. CA-210063]